MAAKNVEYQISLKDLLSGKIKEAEGNVNSFERKIDEINRKFDSLQNGASKSLSFAQTTGAVAFADMLTFGIKQAGQEAVNQVKSVINAGLDASKLRAEFATLLGGRDAGDALFGDLTKYIQDSIFGTELYGSAKTLLAYGEAAQQIMPDMKMLGDIAMGDKEKMQSLTLAFGQTMAAGKLQGDDLRQYIATGFNPLKELAEMTGKSYEVMKDRMSDSKISAEMVRQAFIHATSEGGKFHGMLEQIGETPFGKLQAMQGNIDAAKQQLGEALLPALSDFMDASRPLIDQLPQMFTALKPTIDEAIHSLADLAKWTSENGETISKLAGVAKVAAEAFVVWKVGTVALSAANTAWAATTTRATTAVVTENKALIQESELVAALAIEYDALTASMTGTIGAMEAKQLAATVANQVPMGAVSMSGMSNITLGATAASMGSGIMGAASRAAIPVMVAYFGGEAVAQMLDANPLTGESWNLKNMTKSGITGSSDQFALGYSVLSTLGVDPIKDAIDEVTESKRKALYAPSDFLNNYGIGSAKANPFFPNSKFKGSSTAGSSTALKEDISKVTGQQVKNYNVTINGGLVHEFTVNNKTVKESAADMKRVVTQALSDAVNDSQYG